MGKRRRLNRLISKWIKSDLPSEERSTVLLLGVTRIPGTPVTSRRALEAAAAAVVVETPLVFGATADSATPLVRRNASITGGRRNGVVRRSSSRKGGAAGRPAQKVPDIVTPSESPAPPPKCSAATKIFDDFFSKGTSENRPIKEPLVMERSVDSIGTCSLDVDGSANNLSDWSEISSTRTLKSTSIVTPPTEPHLPSYLSLACTVNGYSTTTNYDPIRLARSRDASPHRIDTDLKKSFSPQNNLLSPPNLVPLPKPKMEHTLTTQQRQFYSSKTMTFMSSAKESVFSAPSIFITKDATDGCVENGHHTKCVTVESKSATSMTTLRTSSVKQEFTNGTETKSFIQQRVERLYGPGALAQGFFVTTKRQRNRLSDSKDKEPATPAGADKHSKSMSDKLLLDVDDERGPAMKQSTSTPTLPVLRHLRPEFRAQLPIISPKKGHAEGGLHKSFTIPKLDDEAKVNGHKIEGGSGGAVARHLEPCIKEESGVKDGHYFLKILETQTKRLLELADEVEREISTPNLSEEVIGKLRSTAGKAKLLVSQKMQQFKGLCTNNINQSAGEAFPTTNEDLQGFWDMVMLQVDQVNALFEDVDKLRKNGWTEPAPVVTNGNAKTSSAPKKLANRPRPTSAVNEQVRKQKEAERKRMIEERRRAMKAQMNKPRESIEIFVPESS